MLARLYALIVPQL